MHVVLSGFSVRLLFAFFDVVCDEFENSLFEVVCVSECMLSIRMICSCLMLL